MGEPQTIPAAPGNTNTVTVPVRTFNEVKTVSLAFIGDHQLLKDNDKDWRNTGNLFPKPEFTYGKKSAPVSRTKAKYLGVEVELEVWPYDAPQLMCTIKGTATWGQTFETKFPLKGGKQTVILESGDPLPDRVTKLSGDIEWTVDNGADGPMKADHSWGHELYITVNTPMNDHEANRQEDGVTLMRMQLAVGWVEPIGSTKPHEVVAGLRARFGGYRLTPSPAVPRELSQPNYFNKLGGAWPMSDYMAEGAECQAMVRLVRGLLRQVGVPGDANIYVVWADPDVQHGKLAIEEDWEARAGSGLDSWREVNGVKQDAALIDGPVMVGTTYPPCQEPMPGGGTSPGLNRYEACLRFAADGETKYYGGGAGVYKNKDEVILAFWGLVWVEFNTDGSYKVVEIVRRY